MQSKARRWRADNIHQFPIMVHGIQYQLVHYFRFTSVETLLKRPGNCEKGKEYIVYEVGIEIFSHRHRTSFYIPASYSI